MEKNQLSMKELNVLFTKECKRRGIIKKTLLKNFIIDFINEKFEEKSIKVDNNSQNTTKDNKTEEKELSWKEKKELFNK